MSKSTPNESVSSLSRWVEFFAVFAMFFMTLGVIIPIAGVNGLRLWGGPNGTDAVMTVPGEVDFAVDFGDPLPKFTSDDGTVSVFGQAPVELAAPTITNVAYLDPTASQRVIWILWQVAGPLLGLAIAWPIRQMARSTRTGDPFTSSNERRLWRIAAFVAAGGIGYSLVAGFAQMLLIQRSAASDLFVVNSTISFAPIAAGVVIAALASVWRIGVGMREELDATI